MPSYYTCQTAETPADMPRFNAHGHTNERAICCTQCFERAPASGFDTCETCIASNLHFGHEQIEDYAEFVKPEVLGFLKRFRHDMALNLHNATLAVLL